MPEGSAGIPCASPSVDPNIYVLSEAIRASMENSMEILSATLQKNVWVMADTIWEGFAARTPSQVARDDSSG